MLSYTLYVIGILATVAITMVVARIALVLMVLGLAIAIDRIIG